MLIYDKETDVNQLNKTCDNCKKESASFCVDFIFLCESCYKKTRDT